MSTRPLLRPASPSITKALARTTAILALLGVAACSPKASEVVPSDAGAAERIDAMEKRVQTLEQERDGAVRSAEAAGLEARTLGQILADLRNRLKAVEERPVAIAPGMDGASGTGSTGPLVAGAVSGPQGYIPAGTDVAYTEEQIAAFRKISDEVQKRKDAEQQADRVRRDLKRANASLSPEQEESVIKLQAQYQAKMRELYQGGFGRTDVERQEATEKLQALRGQFETDLRAQIPATEADKIVETMRMSFPGFFRTPGGARQGGMNGNMGGN